MPSVIFCWASQIVAQFPPGVHVLGVDFQGLAEVGLGLGQLAAVPQTRAQVDVALLIVGADFDRLEVVSFGFTGIPPPIPCEGRRCPS